ncbi:MAG: FAD-dependent oxidoreductase [Balneola sp.]
MNTKIAVIGAGVSGITTGVLLQQLGYKVTIYSNELPLTSKQNPAFPSQFPSASIIPHSVFHSEIDTLFNSSQFLFSSLHNSNFSGLRIHEHYELFGYDTPDVTYTRYIEGFSKIEELDWSPQHPDIEIKSGWKFNSYFADWNSYLPQLIKIFNGNNGQFIQQKVDLNSYEGISEDIVINCSGTGSHQLESEIKNPLILLGHLLKVKETPELLSPNKNTVSFNFTPGIDTYSDSFKTPFDVYTYPRGKDWILGGSRFKGTLDNEGKWVSHDALSTIFPDQIISLNADIINHSFGIDLKLYTNREFQQAYRYVRDTENGLRLEAEENSNKLVIHNYGHGGAGVTLSWGTAFKVSELISARTQSTRKNLDEISELLTIL